VRKAIVAVLAAASLVSACGSSGESKEACIDRAIKENPPMADGDGVFSATEEQATKEAARAAAEQINRECS
jgi:major membrane immunogen (membrane-anchored lipoprotein)